MNKNFKNLAILAVAIFSTFNAMASSVTADTIPQKTTSRGVKYENNRNLHFTNPDRTHTEVEVGGHYTGFEGNASYGINLQATEVFTPTKNFAWRVGGQSFIDYSSNWGAMADVAGVIGIRLGNAVSFGIDGIVGMTQMPSFASTSHPSGNYGVNHYYTHWRFAAGVQANLNFKLGKKVSLGVFARYLHAFNNTDNVLYNEPEGWSTTPTEFYTDKWSVGLNLGFNIFSEAQKSGDNCWLAGTYAGYSFAAHKGALVGFDMYHFKRTGYYGARTFGFGIEQAFPSVGQSTNAIYGKAGYQIMPNGAKSVVLINFGGEVGIGEYGRTISATADNFSYDYRHHATMLGVFGRASVGVTFNLGRFNIELNGKVGYHTGFSSSFDEMTGETSALHGLDGCVTAGFHWSF